MGDSARAPAQAASAVPGPGVDGVPGPVLFARYAFPPNLHGYCGPDDHSSFFDYAVAGVDGSGLRSLAHQFTGALPYLSLIADVNGIEDPLDPRVVEAYWVGSPRLDEAAGASAVRRLGAMADPTFATTPVGLSERVRHGGVPHHSFAVFFVYPWSGLLGDPVKAPQAVMVLDRCRIRPGRVLEVRGDQVVVESAPLTWDGARLCVGDLRTETATRSANGVGMLAGLEIGEAVALHWDWVCDRLSQTQVAHLDAYTSRHLRILNESPA